MSKDDKLLASGTQKGSVNLWALNGHKKASKRPGHPPDLFFVSAIMSCSDEHPAGCEVVRSSVVFSQSARCRGFSRASGRVAGELFMCVRYGIARWTTEGQQDGVKLRAGDNFLVFFLSLSFEGLIARQCNASIFYR